MAKPYLRRRFGELDVNLGTEFGTIVGTEAELEKLIKTPLALLVENKIFKKTQKLSIVIFYIHILIQIQFIDNLGKSILYFNIIEGICLGIVIFRVILKIIEFRIECLIPKRVIETISLILCVIVYIIEIYSDDLASMVVFKVVSILRFAPLLLIPKKTKNSDKDKSFAIIPFKTNSERLVGLLRSLREVEWIKNKPKIDSELEWGIRVICNETLYNIEIYSENKEQEDVINWAMKFKSGFKLNKVDIIALPNHPDLDHSSDAISYLKKIESITFNVFKLKEATNNNELVVLTNHILCSHNLFKTEKINERNFFNFMTRIQAGYNINLPYHNATHAADVVQAIYFFIKGCKINDFCELSSSDIAIIILSGSVHDFQHVGHTNNFLISTSDPLAILYNDRSVLESHHIAASFKIIHEPSNNIFIDMSEENIRKYRSEMIKLVLATDFSRHFKDLSKFKLKFSGNHDKGSDKSSMMQMIIHAADVSNSMRKWKVYHQWAKNVLQEFFAQGDREKELGIPVSPLCDRNTTNFPKSQIGFIDLFIIPIFSTLKDIIPEFEKCEKNVLENKQKLQYLVEDKKYNETELD